MNIFGKKNSSEEVEEKTKKGKSRYSIFNIIIIVLLLIAVIFIIIFNKQQNQISSNSYNTKINEAENIVGRKAIITEFQGDVVINRNKIDVNVFNDFRLEVGDIIKTGLDSFVKIDIDGNKILKMDANSIIEISAMSGNEVDNITTITLSTGRLMNDIKEKLNVNSRYEIKTLNTIIGVKGTIFAVTCESNNDNNYFTKVENFSGSVEVSKINIQNSNEVLNKIILDTNKYTVVEEKTNKQEELQINEIDKNKLDEFIKIDLDKMLIEKNNKENVETNTIKTPSTVDTIETPSTSNAIKTPSISNNTDVSNSTTDNSSSKVNNEIPIIKDLEKPTLIISGPTVYSVKVGEKIKFVAQYFDNVGIREVVLTPGHIVLHEFQADINITGTGNSRIILLSNIQGNIGENKYIEILSGTSIDTNGNVSSNAKSAIFRLEKQNFITSEPKPTSIIK
ncbi:MAG: FecR domain-containing protein [Clostridia bacterium]|nr:FecR domain-containing protein [Clostridia bacterium]MDD4387127.1 FecR domain-containing protein [Clostridia bacterium]